jgi:hypothetical protein
LDLEKLFDLWILHYNKVVESDRRLLPLRPVYYLAPKSDTYGPIFISRNRCLKFRTPYTTGFSWFATFLPGIDLRVVSYSR